MIRIIPGAGGSGSPPVGLSTITFLLETGTPVEGACAVEVIGTRRTNTKQMRQGQYLHNRFLLHSAGCAVRRLG
jgi:hypothetical protein